MKIFHTADWHLGQTLHSRKRYQEFSQFLNWLTEKISSESVDVLLISGDLFDSSSPSNHALQLYNNFLASISQTCCQHVVITGGNHDSPSLLNAQRNILKLLQIHIVGGAEKSAQDEVLLLHDLSGAPSLIVCAVPYLRDRDLRSSEPGQSPDDRAKKLIEGISSHYIQVAEVAESVRSTLPHWIPIIGMGHLFASGASSQHGDGTRDLYVGSLAHFPATLFPSTFDYIALGHLHSPQIVAKSEKIRYSGSPLPISFTEAEETKKIICLEFLGKTPIIKEISIPRFQELKRIRGDWPVIHQQINESLASNSPAYLEIIYSGGEFIDAKNLSELHSAVENSPLEILKILNEQKKERILASGSSFVALDELHPLDVFRSVLINESVPESLHNDLITKFLEAEKMIAEADPNGADL